MAHGQLCRINVIGSGSLSQPADHDKTEKIKKQPGLKLDKTTIRGETGEISSQVYFHKIPVTILEAFTSL